MREMLLAVLTPATVLALVMGTLLAGVFHLLAATRGSRLLVSWTVGVTFFGIGTVLSDFLHLSVLSLGPIDVILPSILSLAAMGVARLAKL
jgi:hypothetical protein